MTITPPPTDPPFRPSKSAQSGEIDVIAGVLAEHVRGDWSDRTYSCQGCNNRTRDEVEARWPHADNVSELRELRARASRASKPDWSLSDYNAHVAEQIVARLLPPGSRGDA